MIIWSTEWYLGTARKQHGIDKKTNSGVYKLYSLG